MNRTLQKDSKSFLLQEKYLFNFTVSKPLKFAFIWKTKVKKEIKDKEQIKNKANKALKKMLTFFFREYKLLDSFLQTHKKDIDVFFRKYKFFHSLFPFWLIF